VEKVRLGDIFSITSGGTPSKKKSEYYINGNIKWVKTGDLKRKYLKETAEYITEQGLNKSSAKMCHKDTVLIAMYGATIGATSILKTDACTNQACAAFAKNENVIPEYLYYFFKSKKNQFVHDAIGGAQPNISIGYLKNVYFNLLDIEEQRKIVTRINMLDEVIDLKTKQIEALDELIKSRFVEMFGTPFVNEKKWKMGTIKDLIAEAKYGTSRPSVEGGRYKYLRMNNITYDGKLDLSNLKFINIPKNELNKCVTKYGDILFNRTNSRELVGKTCVYNLNEEMVIAGFIIRIRTNEFANPYFIGTYLNTKSLKNKLYNMCKNASGQSNINAQELQNIEIYIPPVKLQNQFAKIVQQIDKQKTQIQTSLEQTQVLQQSLMNQYFR